jgi:poly(3-hydroxybutyrate) depolymerase
LLQRTTSPRAFLVALLLAGAAGADAPAGAPQRLEPLPLDREAVTISGLSSGGAMAVQFHTAHSRLVQGVAVLAGPPYYCAEGAIDKALGRCMKDGASIPVERLLQQADRWAEEGLVDAADGIAQDKVWLYRGAADPHVHVTVVDALERYYRERGIPPARLVRIERDGAGHNMPIAARGAAPCAAGEPPYLASCDYDAARALLEHLYGPFSAGTAARTTAATAPLQTFDQRAYAAAAGSVSFADEGWLYVPTTCSSGASTPCRLHVVFHGCRQGANEVGDAFVRRSGYLEAAEAGRVVLLFPQVKPTMQPLNPLGCWDWWGYEGPEYATRRGPQVAAVRAMIDDLLPDTLAREDGADADRN